MTNFLTSARLRIFDFLDTLKHDGVGAALRRLKPSGALVAAPKFAVGQLLERFPASAIGQRDMPPLAIASLSLVILVGGGIGLLAVTAGEPKPIPAPVVWLDIAFPEPPIQTSPAIATASNRSVGPSADPRAHGAEQGAPRSQPPAHRPGAAVVSDEIALTPAPDPALVVETDSGMLPVIAPDGREAWRVYARPFADPYQRPRIGILLAGLGMSQSATLTAVQQLPGAVTLSYNPYAQKLQEWIDQTRAAGHEVMLELPMEPVNYPDDDPGPHTLLTSMDTAANLERTEWLLGRFVGYVGVTNYMGSRFTASPKALSPVLRALQKRGLMFLDSRTSDHSVAGQIADEIGLVQATSNRFLDTKASRAAIDARLADLERIARATGSAIGIASPYPVSIERIAAWAETLEGRGLILAPISSLAARGMMTVAEAPVQAAESDGHDAPDNPEPAGHH
jgi:uncharacterized protein